MADDPNPQAPWEHNFAQRMRQLREARNMTQTDLARALKAAGLPFHQQTVQRMENGERPVRLNEAHLIARALDVDLSVMLAEETTDQELRFAVDALRQASLDTSELVAAAFTKWLAAVDRLGEAMRPRMAADADQLDPATEWGLAWVSKTLHAEKSFRTTWEYLRLISGRPDKGGTHQLPDDDLIHLMETWYTEHIQGHEDREAWLMPPQDVYDRFPAREG